MPPSIFFFNVFFFSLCPDFYYITQHRRSFSYVHCFCFFFSFYSFTLGSSSAVPRVQIVLYSIRWVTWYHFREDYSFFVFLLWFILHIFNLVYFSVILSLKCSCLLSSSSGDFRRVEYSFISITFRSILTWCISHTWYLIKEKWLIDRGNK